jgi:hypothetical protein
VSEPSEYEEEAAEVAYQEQLLEELGPEWAEENGFALYEDAIKEFTAERLQSYYVANPNVAGPAYRSLVYAQSLMPSHPKAALVFAVTATELAIKTVLLKPIVFGLVHTEALASFITDLTTKHTGMDNFQTILTEVLARFGGVDLKVFKRAASKKTLWQEIGELQKARNAVVHRGDDVDDAIARLGIAVAATLLNEVFPQILTKLVLHLHDPMTVCAERHGFSIPVHFPIPGHVPAISATVILYLKQVDLDNMPEVIAGRLLPFFSQGDPSAVRSAGAIVPMWITSTPVQYNIRFVLDSDEFTGTKVVPTTAAAEVET